MELTLDQALKRGVEAHKAGKLQEADRYYTAILKANPKHPDANHNMGVLAVGIGKVEAAIPFFKTALEANSSTTQYWLSYIDALMKLDRIADAKAVFDGAKSNGVQGDAFDQIEKSLEKVTQVEGSQPDEEILEKAIGLRESGKYDEAIDLLLSHKKQLLADPNLLAILSHCYILSDNLEQAKIYLDVAKNINPKIATVGWNETRLLVKQKKVNAALAIAKKTNKLFPDDVEGIVALGSCLRANGSFDESLKYLNKAIELNANYSEALINRGLIYLNKADNANALADLEKAHILKPHIKQIWHLVLNLKMEAKDFENTIAIAEEMVKLDPVDEKVFASIALCHQHLKNYDQAVIFYNKALFIKPDYAEAYNNMGLALKEQGKQEDAVETYRKALSIKPNFPDAHNNMGIALKEQGKHEDAIKAFNKALAIKPNYAQACYNMGTVLKAQNKLKKAILAYKKALSINPDYAEAYNNMGIALKDQGKLKEAILAYKKALSIKPSYAEAHNNMGIALKDQGKLKEAILAYKQALSIKPDYAEAHQNLSFVLLNSGNLKEGLDEYEWRWKNPERLSSARVFLKPLWDGQKSLKGKRILFWSEQGVADTINWSSGLSFVASKAQHCILECQQKLVPLLARSLPNVEVRPENRSLDSQRNDFDFHLPMGSLYRHIIATDSSGSSGSSGDAFLVPDPVRIKFWQERLNSLGKGPYIGVSWKSSVITPERLHNYAPISELSPVFKIPNATFINLQYRDFQDDLNKIQGELGVKVHNFDDLDQFENLEDVAALSAALDIVVSTHNVLIMIAPKVGTPTKFASWRQSPWNNVLFAPKGPSLDLYERNTWEPWEQVFRLIAKDIINNHAVAK